MHRFSQVRGTIEFMQHTVLFYSYLIFCFLFFILISFCFRYLFADMFFPLISLDFITYILCLSATWSLLIWGRDLNLFSNILISWRFISIWVNQLLQLSLAHFTQAYYFHLLVDLKSSSLLSSAIHLDLWRSTQPPTSTGHRVLRKHCHYHCHCISGYCVHPYTHNWTRFLFSVHRCLH